MPHRTFAEVAKRRLVGKEGRSASPPSSALMAELPLTTETGPTPTFESGCRESIEDTRVRWMRPSPRLDPGATRGPRRSPS